MNAEVIAARLRALAERVRYLSPPLSRDPERFHIERSEAASAILSLADEISPDSRHGTKERERQKQGGAGPKAQGRVVTERRVTAGRVIVVQKRRPFRIFVG